MESQESIGITPSQILKEAKAQYQEMVDNPQNNRGETGRGMKRAPERAFPETYSESLPSFEGKDIVALIQEAVDRNERVAKETGSLYAPPTFIDVGYGSGYFLLDAKQKWGDKLRCIGYGPRMDTRLSYLGNPPTAQALENARVELIEGDIIDIDKNIHDADIMSVSQVIGWTQYPHWELVKKLYRTTAENGIGLMNACQLEPENAGFDLEALLNKDGYQFELNRKKTGHVAFRKTKPKIELPVIGVVKSDLDNRYGTVRLTKSITP